MTNKEALQIIEQWNWAKTISSSHAVDTFPCRCSHCQIADKIIKKYPQAKKQIEALL